MTFELDAAGARLWELLAASPAEEKTLCVDAFSTVKVSDALVYGRRYWTDRALREEARRTRNLLSAGERDGVRIVATNPVGRWGQRYLMRNHKKLMVVDDRAYLGGINFSEHNFGWHDMMLETRNPALVESLAQDFARTISGKNQSGTADCGGDRLYLLDGWNSRAEFEALLGEITGAQRSVTVISPYLTNPLLGRLKALSSSAQVRIISPADNNKPIVRRALTRAAGDSDIELLLHRPGMSHLKAALIDDERLILGSYNFDFVGYEVQQEVAVSTGNPSLIGDFRERALGPILAASRPAQTGAGGWLNWSGWGMKAAEWYAAAVRMMAYR